MDLYLLAARGAPAAARLPLEATASGRVVVEGADHTRAIGRAQRHRPRGWSGDDPAGLGAELPGDAPSGR